MQSCLKSTPPSCDKKVFPDPWNVFANLQRCVSMAGAVDRAVGESTERKCKTLKAFFHYLCVWGSYVPKKGLRWYASIGWYTWVLSYAYIFASWSPLPSFHRRWPWAATASVDLFRSKKKQTWHAWWMPGTESRGKAPTLESRIWKCTVFREVHDNCSKLGKVIGVWWTLQSIP